MWRIIVCEGMMQCIGKHKSPFCIGVAHLNHNTGRCGDTIKWAHGFFRDSIFSCSNEDP
jgi:hypothetical protein